MGRRETVVGGGGSITGSAVHDASIHDLPVHYFDYTGSKIMPSLAKDWKVSDDGKAIAIYLRKGAKWSDGEPLTAVKSAWCFRNRWRRLRPVIAPANCLCGA
ncbi:MAG: hypothetical protein JXA21_24595 [Anaerolineae bacterium]|nr:hypothetical protein [Anaerolineae bacterium]